MKAIYKYSLPVNDLVEVQMPAGAVILSLQVQRDQPCIWVMVDPRSDKKETRRFRTIGTGHPIEDNFAGRFIGTYQLYNGYLVFHVFEVD